jgi:hypothetical protein
LRPIYLRIEKIISIQVKIDQAYIDRHVKCIKTSSFKLYTHLWHQKSAGTFSKNNACPGTKPISGVGQHMALFDNRVLDEHLARPDNKVLDELVALSDNGVPDELAARLRGLAGLRSAVKSGDVGRT